MDRRQLLERRISDASSYDSDESVDGDNASRVPERIEDQRQQRSESPTQNSDDESLGGYRTRMPSPMSSSSEDHPAVSSIIQRFY